MTRWDMTKRKVSADGKVITTGQKITPLFSDDTVELKERVSEMENKLDTILTLLNKEANNDKTGFKPVSGNDSGV